MKDNCKNATKADMTVAATYQELAPSGTLARYVDACWFYQPQLDEPKVDILIPEGVVDLVFNFGAPYYREPVNQSSSGEWISGDMVVGQRTHLFSITWPRDTSLFAIRLKPETAYAFIDQPMHEITNRTIPLKDTGFQALSGAVHAFSFQDRSGIAKYCFDFLTEQMSLQEAPDSRISTMIEAIERYEGSVDIQSLCDQLGFNRPILRSVPGSRSPVVRVPVRSP
jgi:hypothetical protein